MGRLIQNLEAWAPVAVVLWLAMVTGWLWRVVESNNPMDLGKRHVPDLIMDRFFSQQLGEQGQVRYTLKALKMTHYPDDDTSHFNDVVLTSFEPGNPPSEVRSRVAVRSEPKDEVVLTGDVVVTRQPGPKQPKTVMNTSMLTVHPNAGTEETDQPVRITYGQDVLTSMGMQVDNKTKISLFKHAHIIYHPPVAQR